MAELKSTPLTVISVYGALSSTPTHSPELITQLALRLETDSSLRILRLPRDACLPTRKPTQDRNTQTYCPQQILKRGWSSKHQDTIPGIICLAHVIDKLNVEACEAVASRLDRVQADVIACGRSGLPIAVTLIVDERPKTIGDCNAFDDRAKTFLTTLKRHIAVLRSSVAASTPSIQPIHDGPVITQVLNRSNLETTAGASTVHLVAQEASVKRFEAWKHEVINTAREWYSKEGARVRNIKRGPPTRIGGLALKARHEFKAAQYYEMRRLFEKAISTYNDSYSSLVSLAKTAKASEYSAPEIRFAAELVHIRLCALHLEGGDVRSSLAQLTLHNRQMGSIPTEDTSQIELWEWKCRQSVVFSGLLGATQLSPLILSALDPISHARCDHLYHLEVAAQVGKGKCPPSRILELLEKLYESHRNRHAKRKSATTMSRKEAILLMHIADERLRVGDGHGAIRDYQRAAAVFSQMKWHILWERALRRIREATSTTSATTTTPSLLETQLSLSLSHTRFPTSRRTSPVLFTQAESERELAVRAFHAALANVGPLATLEPDLLIVWMVDVFHKAHFRLRVCSNVAFDGVTSVLVKTDDTQCTLVGMPGMPTVWYGGGVETQMMLDVMLEGDHARPKTMVTPTELEFVVGGSGGNTRIIVPCGRRGATPLRLSMIETSNIVIKLSGLPDNDATLLVGETITLQATAVHHTSQNIHAKFEFEVTESFVSLSTPKPDGTCLVQVNEEGTASLVVRAVVGSDVTERTFVLRCQHALSVVDVKFLDTCARWLVEIEATHANVMVKGHDTLGGKWVQGEKRTVLHAGDDGIMNLVCGRWPGNHWFDCVLSWQQQQHQQQPPPSVSNNDNLSDVIVTFSLDPTPWVKLGSSVIMTMKLATSSQQSRYKLAITLEPSTSFLSRGPAHVGNVDISMDAPAVITWELIALQVGVLTLPSVVMEDLGTIGSGFSKRKLRAADGICGV